MGAFRQMTLLRFERPLAIVLAAFMAAFVLSACGDDSGDETGSNPAKTTGSAKPGGSDGQLVSAGSWKKRTLTLRFGLGWLAK